ncbi:MAG: hypothetical protein PHX51_05175 [Clostridia bacterium]|nr:hypothetical protein [Clostridia bacterium]
MTFRAKTGILIFVALLLLMPMLLADKLFVLTEIKLEEREYKGVLIVWHVESFEGGMGSRISWLKRKGNSFAKTKSGLFVEVMKMTAEQTVDALEKGERFDVISYPHSLGKKLAPYLAKYGGAVSISNAYAQSGKSAMCAVAYMCGGYALIARESTVKEYGDILELPLLSGEMTAGKSKAPICKVVWGSNGNSPETAFAALGFTQEQTESVARTFPPYTQYQAYAEFINGRTVTLLGTQRDLSRITNRQKQGFEAVEYLFVGGYTDLVQYVSVCADTDMEEISQSFIEYLTSVSVQSSLVSIEMYNVCGLEIYTAAPYTEMEKALNGNIFVPEVF